MKATKHVPDPVPVVVTLEMTEEEARLLRQVVDSVTDPSLLRQGAENVGRVNLLLGAISDALIDAGVYR